MTRLQLIGDDLPSCFLREMLLNRSSKAEVKSDDDAVLEAGARCERSPHPRRLREYGPCRAESQPEAGR